MQIDPSQLPRHLERQLSPLYVVYGEETLLAIEAIDRIRAGALARGHTEREVLTVEAGFEWRRLWATGASLSLFASKRLLEVRLGSALPGAEGGDALARYAETPPPDVVTIVSLGKLERRTRETRWFTALEHTGVVVHAQKVGNAELPAWLRARLEAQHQSASPEIIEFLAARVEGNLLAAHQEVLKLGLLFPPGPLEPEAVRAAVMDVARFDVFGLGPAVLGGDAVHAVRIIDGLRAEAVAPPLVLLALAEEARTLLRVQRTLAAGGVLSQALRDSRVWGDRQRAMPGALRRVTTRGMEAALLHAAGIDRMIKGLRRGDPWDELRQLALRIAAPGKAVMSGVDP